MAILYNIKKLKDIYTLEVSQDSTYVLKRISGGVITIIKQEDVIKDSVTVLPLNEDGNYTLQISAEEETTIDTTIFVIKNLQNSIIIDIFNLLCGVNCGKSLTTSSCISEADKEIIKAKNIFSKILTYQSLYIPTYGENYLGTFATFLQEGLALSKCNLQTSVNNIIKEECISISTEYNLKLFKTHLFIYWAGFYFTERTLVEEGDTVEDEFVKSKFFYNDIISCGCNLCFNITDLDELFDGSGIAKEVNIYSFQFDGASLGVVDLDLITDEYLENTALTHTEESLLGGKEITFINIGRIGFAVKTVNENPYNIFDVLLNNITTIVFDKVYDSERGILFYLSKNFGSPATIYYKFEKI